MRQVRHVESWVVYRMTLSKTLTEVNVVCEQGEWDAMEQQSPGLYSLVRAGITSEEEAEKLARGTTGDSKPRRKS